MKVGFLYETCDFTNFVNLRNEIFSKTDVVFELNLNQRRREQD